jgi:peptidoglycan/xylan/chitin deacetylase (PgdA/CDA1 family)
MSDSILESTLWLNVCVHEVSDHSSQPCPWILNGRLLDEILLTLQNEGWVATPPGGPEPSVPRRLLLTIDDARAGALDWLAKSEVAANVRAMIFPVPLFIDHAESVPLAERYSDFGSWGQLRDALRCGHQIGSHGLTHISLTTLRPDQLSQELDESRGILEDKLAQPLRDLALPYGRHDDTVLAAARKSGYRYVHSTLPGLIDRSQMQSGLLCRFVLRSDLPHFGLEHPRVTR